MVPSPTVGVRGRRLAPTYALSLLLVVTGQTLGLAVAAEPPALSGSFSVSYAFSLLGGQPAENTGILARADLKLEVDGKTATLTLDPLGLRRRAAKFELRQGAELFSVDYRNTPSNGLDPQRGDTTEVQALVVARPDGAPSVQALIDTQSVAGANGNSSLVARVGLNDRYREPFAGVSSLDWRASLQTTSIQLAATGAGRTSVSTSFGVGLAFGGERDRSFRPKVDVTWRSSAERAAAGAVPAGAAAEQSLRLRTGLGLDLGEHETIDLGADWEFTQAGARTTKDAQSFGLRSSRLAPLSLSVSFDRSAGSAGQSAYSWGLGGDTKLGEVFSVGLGYRGEADEVGSGHGVTGNLGARWAGPAITVRSSLSGSAMWRDDGTLSPTAAFNLAVLTPATSTFDLTLGASLKYDERLAAAINAAGAADFGPLQLTFDTELAYATALSLSGGATAAIDVIELEDRRLGVQLGLEATTTSGGYSAASVDLGLRYAFGESR